MTTTTSGVSNTAVRQNSHIIPGLTNVYCWRAPWITRLLVGAELLVRHGERQAEVFHVPTVVGLEEHEVTVQLGVQAVKVVEQVEEVVVSANEAKEERGELRLDLVGKCVDSKCIQCFKSG